MLNTTSLYNILEELQLQINYLEGSKSRKSPRIFTYRPGKIGRHNILSDERTNFHCYSIIMDNPKSSHSISI